MPLFSQGPKILFCDQYLPKIQSKYIQLPTSLDICFIFLSKNNFTLKNHYKKAASPSSLSNSSFSVTTSLLFHFGRSANTKVFKLRKASLNNVTFIVVVLMVLKYYTSCLESKKMESVRGVTCRS